MAEWLRLRKRETGQHTAEFAVLIVGIVTVAVIAMESRVRMALQGGIKQTTEEILGVPEPDSTPLESITIPNCSGGSLSGSARLLMSACSDINEQGASGRRTTTVNERITGGVASKEIKTTTVATPPPKPPK